MGQGVRLKAVQFGGLASSRFLRLGREFFWVGLGQTGAALGGIVGVRLLTHALPPAAYGELALGMTVALLAQQVVFSPLSGASLRFHAPAQHANELPAYLKGVKRLSTRATALLLAVASVFSLGLWVSAYAKWLGLAVAAFVFALLSGYSQVIGGMQNAARHRVVVAWHDGLAIWLRFLIAVTVIAVLGAFSQVAMLGYALASAVVLVSQFWFFRRGIVTPAAAQPIGTSADVRSWTNKMYAYAWPFGTWGLFTWAQMASDRWALQAFSTTSAVGLYAVLYQLGYWPISMASGMIMQFVSPVLFSRAGGGSDPARIRQTRRLNMRLVLGGVMVTVLATALAFVTHAWIFSLLVAPKYHDVSSLLPWIVLAGGVFGSGQTASLLLMTNVTTKNLIAPKIGTALLGIVLSFAGAYAFGLPGVVFASLLFSCVYCAWIMHLVHKIRGDVRLLGTAVARNSL